MIQDIKRVDTRSNLLEAIEEEKARSSWELTKLDNRTLMKELYDRGVTVGEYFGVSFELEEAGNGRQMTVEDIELAGFMPQEDRSL